jgi:hypothetical protein
VRACPPLPTGGATRAPPRNRGAGHVVLNSVIFRSSDQTLTTTGTYTEMGSRLLEPVLLGLGLLVIRSRVKR